MTRRVSKRDMLRRLDGVAYARIHLDNVRSSSAHVVLDGVTCAVNFPRKARHELLRESGIYGNLAGIPAAIGDGYMPPGCKSDDYARGRLRNNAELPLVKVFDQYTQAKEQAFLLFQKRYPVGAITNGRVILVNRRDAILDLGLGLLGRLDAGESLDHTPGSSVKWLSMPKVGEVLDVYVRDYHKGLDTVRLSRHTYQREDRYCNYASGYRQRFDPKGACFEKFPWEKSPC